MTAALNGPGATLHPMVNEVAEALGSGFPLVSNEGAPSRQVVIDTLRRLRQQEDCSTQPDPASVDWPDAIGCPFRPHGMRGEWYVFEERFAAPGLARQQVYLSDYQIRRCLFVTPLALRTDWLAHKFPLPGGGDYDFDVVAAVAWIRHHINEATSRRRDHARRDEPPVAVQVQALRQEAPQTWAMRLDPASQTHAVAAVRTLTVTRDDKGKRALALTIFVPGMRDLISVGVKLPEQAAQELSDVLAGIVRAR